MIKNNIRSSGTLAQVKGAQPLCRLQRQRVCAVTLILMLLLCGCGNNGNAADTSQSVAITESTAASAASPVESAESSAIAAGTILHAWCWSFDTIRESMADISAAGYTAVQTSPANAVVEGGNGGMQLMGRGKWYYQYQPTGLTVGNYQLGTEQQFRDMCAEADKYGIKVIVDVVPNHTASDISAVSDELKSAVGGEEALYHKNYLKRINNYSSRIECTSYSLSGLPDVNTENPAYQDALIAYMQQLIADGADGFRFDAAKHIALPDDPQADESAPNTFWERITTAIDNRKYFMYGEVLQGDNERIAAYADIIGHVTASDYGKRVRGLIEGKMLNSKMLSDHMAEDVSGLVTWVESHDTYADGSSAQLTEAQITLGWAIIAAQGGNTTPLFLARPYGSSERDRWGRMNRIGAAGSPLYKSQPIAALNRFRTAMTGETTELRNTSDNNVLMIDRGSRGTVLVCCKTAATDISEPTSLPDGEYPDRGGMNGTFTVKGGILTGSIAPESVAVLYNDGYTEPDAMPSVSLETDTFVIDGTLTAKLHVTGAAEGEYTLGGNNAAYKDGDRLDIPAGTQTVRLTAKSADGRQTVMTYYFTDRRAVPAGSTVTFTKPASWGDTIYVYIYNETVSPIIKNAVWPGVEMTLNEDGTYTYTLDRDWDSALVIFSDGKSQFPAAMEPGIELTEEMYFEISNNG